LPIRSPTRRPTIAYPEVRKLASASSGESSTISSIADVTDSKTASICEFFVAGDDIYTLFVGSEPGKMDAAVVRAFFGSFQLAV